MVDRKIFHQSSLQYLLRLGIVCNVYIQKSPKFHNTMKVCMIKIKYNTSVT